MNTIVLYDDSVDIPDGISDLAGFCRWVHSDDFPETGRICFLHGRVWVDMSKEQVFTHNQLKQEFNLVVGGLVKAERLGRFFPDGLFLTNDRAQLACQPDGTFVSRQPSMSYVPGVRAHEASHIREFSSRSKPKTYVNFTLRRT